MKSELFSTFSLFLIEPKRDAISPCPHFSLVGPNDCFMVKVSFCVVNLVFQWLRWWWRETDERSTTRLKQKANSTGHLFAHTTLHKNECKKALTCFAHRLCQSDARDCNAGRVHAEFGLEVRLSIVVRGQSNGEVWGAQLSATIWIWVSNDEWSIGCFVVGTSLNRLNSIRFFGNFC